MDNQVEANNSLKDSTKIALFLAYSALGVTGAGYFTFNVIKKRNQMQIGHKLTPIARRQLIWKYGTIGVFIWLLQFFLSLSYLISIGYFLSKIRPMEMLFKMALNKNHEYNEKIKGDPVFQQYYIFKTLDFFKVSPELVDRVHQQLKIITEQKQNAKESINDKYIDFDRQLLQHLMKRQKKFKLDM